MLARPQLCPIFLSLFVFSVSFSMQKSNPEVLVESDEDELYTQDTKSTHNNSHNNSNGKQKRYTKEIPTHSREDDIIPKSTSKKTNIPSNTNKSQKSTKKRESSLSDLESAEDSMDFGAFYASLKNKTLKTDQYQPKGRYSDPSELNSNYKQFIKTAPELVALKILGLKEYPEIALENDFFKRLLFYGEPGNGKTSLAKAMALEAFGKYYFIETPRLLNSYKNCHTNLFDEINPLIEKGEPIAIIWDEMNCVTDQHKNHHSSDEIMPTAFSLLLDYCAEKAPFLFMIGTTNNHPDDFPDKIDSRFDINDDRVFIPCPDFLKRQQIMNDRFKGKQSTLTEDDKRILLEKLEGRTCRNIAKVLGKTIAYSLKTNQIITRELVDLAIETSPLRPSKYQRIAQKYHRTEDEIKELEADKALIDQNRGVIDQIEKQNQIKLQEDGLNQADRHHQENFDKQNKNAAYQTFSSLKMKSRDRSVQINGGINGGVNLGTSGINISGGVNFDGSGTHHVVIDNDYEVAKNSLPEEQRKYFKEAQTNFTAAQIQVEQNQPDEQIEKDEPNTWGRCALKGMYWLSVGPFIVIAKAGANGVIASGKTVKEECIIQ